MDLALDKKRKSQTISFSRTAEAIKKNTDERHPWNRRKRQS